MSDKDDTIALEEIFVHKVRQRKSIEELMDNIADYHYVYGRDRSWFMADWTQEFKDAIYKDSLSNYRDPHHHTRSKVMEILKGASEYSAYGVTDQMYIQAVNTISEQGHECYEEFKKTNFLLSLAGEREKVW